MEKWQEREHKRGEIIKDAVTAADRIILDGSDVYHLGASLKDLGKQWFAFSKMAMDAIELLAKVKVDG